MSAQAQPIISVRRASLPTSASVPPPFHPPSSPPSPRRHPPDRRSPTTDHRPPTTDHRPPTTDHRPPTPRRTFSTSTSPSERDSLQIYSRTRERKNIGRGGAARRLVRFSRDLGPDGGAARVRASQSKGESERARNWLKGWRGTGGESGRP
jgi:hypothetical protein